MQQEPNAIVILFGSNARGEEGKDSDIDLGILLDKKKISYEEEKKISYPLYDLKFETGQIISPIGKSRQVWESWHKITPLYENIQQDGIK